MTLYRITIDPAPGGKRERKEEVEGVADGSRRFSFTPRSHTSGPENGEKNGFFSPLFSVFLWSRIRTFLKKKKDE